MLVKISHKSWWMVDDEMFYDFLLTSCELQYSIDRLAEVMKMELLVECWAVELCDGRVIDDLDRGVKVCWLKKILRKIAKVWLKFFTLVDTPACLLDKLAVVVDAEIQDKEVHVTCCYFLCKVVAHSDRIQFPPCQSTQSHQLSLCAMQHHLSLQAQLRYLNMRKIIKEHENFIGVMRGLKVFYISCEMKIWKVFNQVWKSFTLHFKPHHNSIKESRTCFIFFIITQL